MNKYKDKERRRKNYDRLKKAGFNSFLATKFKDYSDEKIDDIIKRKKGFDKDMEGAGYGIIKKG